MFKNKRKELEKLNADEINQRLGEYYEKQLGNLTDRKTGTLTTAFRIAKTLFAGQARDLFELAAVKNNVDIETHDETLQDIIATAENRGSGSADKIKKYLKAIQYFKSLDKKQGNSKAGIFSKIKNHIQIAKNNPPANS